MKGLFTRWALLALALLHAGVAGAAPLASATLTLRSDDLGMAPVSFPAAGATGVASGVSAVTLDAGHAFDGSLMAKATQLPFPSFYRYLKITVLGNDAGNLSGTPIAGLAPFSLRLALAHGPDPDDAWTPFVITIGAPQTRGASLFVPTYGGTTFLRIDGTGWEQASNALTPHGAGVLNLVTPIVFSSWYVGPATMYADLQLVFVPEPATALVLGWGIVCLGIAGRRRMRAR